jgi:hypothetical protein
MLRTQVWLGKGNWVTDLRTAIRWLIEHDLSESAEVWCLSHRDIEPITELRPVGPDFVVESRSIWSEPTPVPLQWAAFYDMLMGSYSGGGTFKWAAHPETFRGSYSVNPQTAVFLLFLPPQTQIIETHAEKMEQRQQQAQQLTQEIDRAWQR